ncbi:MAG: 6-hydroxymethylpterin diphosphokinase MptE-like protein [Promethearchaeota archaeon]|jgi:uncharacterized Rossmann fold enzyme
MESTLKAQLNNFDEFKVWYAKILSRFKFSYKRDCEARNYLAKILLSKSQIYDLEQILRLFKRTLHSKPNILIFGCGPSLENTVEYILKHKGLVFFKDFINIAADGAAVLLKEKSIPITAIFSDLDGITQEEFNYTHFNIIHAHGDNIEKIKVFKEDIIKFEKIIGTTQVEPIENVLNPGGFTDGDRILFFLHKLIYSSQKIFLIGMDFKNIVGKYSKLSLMQNEEASIIKKKKLKMAVELIEWVSTRIANQIFVINSEEVFHKLNYLHLDEFVQSW